LSGSSLVNIVSPVIVPPGWARLRTSPASTGSSN
jgi:hypothetical protein